MGLPFGDDSRTAPSWDSPHSGFVLILLITEHQDVLEPLTRQELGHGASQHRLACPRLADHDDVSSLLRGLPDHYRGSLLSDYLVNELVGNRHVRRRVDVDSVDPLLDGGLAYRVLVLRGPEGRAVFPRFQGILLGLLSALRLLGILRHSAPPE